MTAFDLTTYHELSDRVLDKLQELYEIDLILDGCAERGVFDRPQDSALDYEAGWGRDYNETRTLHLGRTDPFDLEVYVYREPGKVDLRWTWTEPDRHDYGFVDTAPADAAAWAVDVRNGFHDLVAPLIEIDSTGYVEAHAVLTRTSFDLDTIREDFAFLHGSGFVGDAADRFFRFFYRPFADIRANHVWALDQLTTMVGHLATVNDVGQLALMNFLQAAEDVLDTQLASRKTRTQDSAAQANAVGVAAGVATIVAGAVAKRPSVGPVTIVAGALAVLASIPAGLDDEIAIRGTRAGDIGVALGDALRNLVVRIDQKYDAIESVAASISRYIDSLQVLHPYADDGGRFNDWRPIQPGLHAGDDQGFHHRSSGRAS